MLKRNLLSWPHRWDIGFLLWVVRSRFVVLLAIFITSDRLWLALQVTFESIFPGTVTPQDWIIIILINMLPHNRHYYSLVSNYTVRPLAITDGSSHDSAPYFQELKARVMGFIKLSKGPLYWQWIYKIGTCLNSQIIRTTVLGGVDAVVVDIA